MSFDPRRVFSVDSAKAIKAQDHGYLNAIHYMAPATFGGVGNLCSHASTACIANCLGLHSGQAAMLAKGADADTAENACRRSRKAKAQAFMRDRQAYMANLERQIRRLEKTAARLGLALCVRLNGSTDIVWERIHYGADRLTLLERFPHIQFVDYTKNPGRLGKAPANLSLTLSFSGENEAACLAALAAGHNVAIVFDVPPATWHGFTVIDGDKHDLRHLDPRGVVVGLTPKGKRAKTDTTGFVVRGYVELPLAA